MLGNLTALSNLSLTATAGTVRTTVPSTIKTTATTGGTTTVNGNTGAALYGSILAGAQATNTGPSWLAAAATPANLTITSSGDLTLAGATAVAGTTTITAPKVTITAAGGVISRGDLSITANGTATGQGLFSSGLLVAGGTVNTALTALTPTNPSGITSSSTTSVQGSTLQQANIVLDAASTATLSLTVNRDAVDALVLGGSTSGTGNAQTDLVVAGAWMAAPNVSMTAPQSPRILHDLIARDGLTITANSATAANKTIRLSPLSQILLGKGDGTSTTASAASRENSSITPPIFWEHLFTERRSSGLGIGCEEVFVFPVAFLFEVLERNETKRRGVDAVAESGRGGAIGKDVAQVGVAFHGARFDAFHTVRCVFFFFDTGGCDWFEKARPTRARIKLVL